MEIRVKEFKKALEVVKPGLAAQEKNIEQSTSFAFLKNKVVTYNDEICVEHPLDGIKLKGAIKSEELYKFLTKIKTDTVKVEIDEDQVLIKSGRARVGFNLDSEIKLPLDDKKLNKKGKWKNIEPEVLEAFDMCRNSAGKDLSEPKLVCVHINEDNYIEASDGYRILRYEIEHPMKSVLIPAASMKHVLSIAPTKVASGKDWIHFSNEAGTILSCRVMNEDFVNTEPMLDSDEKGIKLSFPQQLAKILDTAEIFAKKEDSDEEVVQISVNKTSLKIHAETETSWFDDELELDKKSKKFSFQITPYVLKDILSRTDSGKILSDRLIFKGDNWTYVTALI